MAGVGYAEAEISDVGSVDASELAFQVGTGLSVAFTEHLSLDMQYRYFSMLDSEFHYDGGSMAIDVEFQMVTGGLRYGF